MMKQLINIKFYLFTSRFILTLNINCTSVPIQKIHEAHFPNAKTNTSPAKSLRTKYKTHNNNNTSISYASFRVFQRWFIQNDTFPAGASIVSQFGLEDLWRRTAEKRQKENLLFGFDENFLPLFPHDHCHHDHDNIFQKFVYW